MQRRQLCFATELLESRTLFTISFGAPSTYPVAGDTLNEPALADFNGDGFLDAVTNHVLTGQASVSVLLNKGDGTFNTQVPYTVGDRPFVAVTGDFNSDGKQDIATTDVPEGTISVLLGNGDGTFQPRVTTQLGAPTSVGSGATEYMIPVELNNDGKLDLIVNNQSELQLVSMLGNGDGTFTKQDDVTFTSISFARIAVGDFSGDGKPDVASNLGNNVELLVYFTDGAGNFDGGHTITPTGLPALYAAEGVSAGDFNGDSKTDVAMLSNSLSTITDPAVLSIFLSNGDGTFQNNVNTTLSFQAYDVSNADLDADGKQDVIVTGIIAGWQALRGNGDGTFATPADVDNPNFSVGGKGTIGDLNNDNKPDVAFTHFEPAAHTLAVYLVGSNGGGGGDGGGGGEGTATATPTILATLPAAVVGGAKVKGAKLAVTVTNSGTTDLTAPVTVSLFASTDATVDGSDTPVGTPVTKVLKLKPGATKPVKLKLTEVPNVPDGDYFLLAQTTANGATGGTAATGTTVNIAAPFVDLTGAFGTPLPATLVPGKKASIPLSILNLGNVAATGTISVNLIARPAGGGPSADATLPTAPVKLKLNPNAAKVTRLKVTLPVESLLPGSYTLVATIDSTNAISESREDNNETTGGPTVVNP
jgi:hypothetical protein